MSHNANSRCNVYISKAKTSLIDNKTKNFYLHVFALECLLAVVVRVNFGTKTIQIK